MEDKKKIEQFTEANSPVRLIEPDAAWAAMQQKLDENWPVAGVPPVRSKWWRFWVISGVVVLIGIVVVFLSQEPGVRSLEPKDSKGNSPESIMDGRKREGSGAERQSETESRSGAGRQSAVDDQKSIVDGRKTPGSRDAVAGSQPAIDQENPDDSGINAGNGQRTADNTGGGKIAGKDIRASSGKAIGPGKIDGPGKTGGNIPGRNRSAGAGKTNEAGGHSSNVRNDVPGNNNSKTPLNHRPAQQQVGNNLQASTTFLLQPAIQKIDVAGHVAPLPKDSSNTKATATDELKNKDKRPWRFMAGLQWAAVLPVKDNSYYTTGSNGSSQVYRHLLPAVVLTVQKNRHRAGINLYPFLQTQLYDKIYAMEEDTFGIRLKKYSLVKMFGYGAGINYAYNFYDNWWVGAGIQGNWWKKGLIHYQYNPSSGGSVDSLLLTGKNDSSWKNFAQAQYKADLELWYDRRQWSLGLQGSLPLVKPVKIPGITLRQPLSVALLFRWKLYSR